jgi:Domain of unknown function (DUF4157)
VIEIALMSVKETTVRKVESPASAVAVPAESHLLQRKCACGGSSSLGAPCSKCADNDTRLRREAAGQQEHNSDVPGIVHEVLGSPGQPLDPQTRAFMEPRFGHDFSKVRVHTDARATQSAASVSALAYTVGQHIVFGAGQFAPASSAGKTLLAHELTHVVQQDSGGLQSGAGLTISPHDDRYEREADSVASQINSNSGVTPANATVGPPLSVAPKLQRQGESREGGGTPGACVAREDIPSSRSGIINGGGTVGERFQVAIQWRGSPAADKNQPGSYCDCACGEYRQYVKGHFIINGNRETAHLWGGAVLEDNVYHEDGLDKNPAARYGHRREPITMDEEFRPDRENGCSYIGRDFPRVMIGSDTDMLFQFKGQTYDACNQIFGPIHEWEVRYAGPIKR